MADGCGNSRGSSPSSSSTASSPCCKSTQTWLPPLQSGSRWLGDRTEQDDDDGDGRVSEPPPSRAFEELFCSPGQGAAPLAPLAGALAAPSWPQSDVVKRGYLGKLERNHRRYFVLRAGSHTGPSRLEWYKSQEKFAAARKSAGKAAAFGSSKQGVIYLRCCLGVSRAGCSRKGHTVALYAKDQTMVLVVEDQREQDAWYAAVKKLMEEERRDEEHGDGIDEEDDGYCTLPPAAFFKEVWPVSVKPRGLGRSKSLGGETRLCLTASSLVLVKLAVCSDSPSVTIPLLGVRRFGHLDGLFFLELGRSALDGPGEVWMEAGDQGIAQHIHEAVRETVRALRALPDFSQSPTSRQPKAPLLSKGGRHKHRDKPNHMKPMTLIPRNPDTHTSPTRSHAAGSPRSPVPESGSYMEMRTEHCGGAARRLEGWELEEEEEDEDEERPGYTMMSPQGSRRSSVSAQDAYVAMESPQRDNGPPYSSPSSGLHTSFHSSTSDDHSPVRPPRPQATDPCQSQASLRLPAERKSPVQRRRRPARPGAASSPLRSVDGRDAAKSPVQRNTILGFGFGTTNTYAP